MEPTDNLRIVDLQVALYAVQSMLEGEDADAAIETAVTTHYGSSGSALPAHALVQLLYSFAHTVIRVAEAKRT